MLAEARGPSVPVGGPQMRTSAELGSTRDPGMIGPEYTGTRVYPGPGYTGPGHSGTRKYPAPEDRSVADALSPGQCGRCLGAERSGGSR